jgi:hypothetical protein
MKKMNQKVLIDSPNIKIVKDNNTLTIQFTLENNNIDIINIINFDLIKIVCDISTNIHEYSNLQVINTNEAKLSIVMKHLLKDLGISQRYTHLHIIKTVDENTTLFSAKTIQDIPDTLDKLHLINVELIPIKQLLIQCETINTHLINIRLSVLLDDFDNDEISCNKNNNLLEFIEKMFCALTKNIITRLKLFIEKLTINNNINVL